MGRPTGGGRLTFSLSDATGVSPTRSSMGAFASAQDLRRTLPQLRAIPKFIARFFAPSKESL
jgi:hypothetical protein